VSGTFCEELALRVLRTKGTGHLFPAHCLFIRNANSGTSKLTRRVMVNINSTRRH